MVSGGRLIEGIFAGDTINTPSMLCVEDYLDALEWGRTVGGLGGLIARADRNAGALDAWVRRTPWVANLAERPEIQSNTSVCLRVVDPAVTALPEAGQAGFAKRLSALLEREGVAHDIASYRDAPAGLRVWCGATVETADVEALTDWLDWAYAVARAEAA